MRDVSRYNLTGHVALVLALLAGAVPLLSACSSRSKLPEISQAAVEAEAARQVAFRFETFITDTKRLQSVAFRVAAANVAYCGQDVRPLFGLSILTIDNIAEELQPIASQRLGLDASVKVVQVVKNSPARRAGLALGDRIIGIGKRRIPEGVKGVATLVKILRKAKPFNAVRIVVLRGGRQLSFSLRPVQGCAYPVVLAGQGDDEDIAEAGGIVVQRSLLRIAASDDDLALAIAHEFAHLVAGHTRRRDDIPANLFGGFPIDEPIKVAAAQNEDPRKTFSDGHEQVADYLGLYFAARAGFNTAGVELFWRRMADENPDAVGFARVHPSSAERFLIITKTKDEIALKRQSKSPLEPNWKKPN